MAVSGSQKTRIGASISGVAKKLSISAKAAGPVATVAKINGVLVTGLRAIG